MAGIPQLNVPIIAEGKARRIEIFASDKEPLGAVATLEVEATSAKVQRSFVGVALSSQVLEKAKPGELDFRTLNQQLVLPTGQTTVKALVDSLTQATGLELYAGTCKECYGRLSASRECLCT